LVLAEQVLTETPTARRSIRLWGLIATIALLAALTVLAPLHSSLWVDEAKTWNVVHDGFRAMPARLWWNNEQSPVFFAFVCASARIFGLSELSLRLPSVMFVGAACVFLYRIARRWFDREISLIAVIAFLANPHVAFAASDARVYGMALCAIALSTLLLLRWTEQARPLDGVLYAIAAAWVIYAHLLWTPALLAQAAFCALAYPSFKWRRPLFAWTAAALLCLPLLPAIRAAGSARAAMSFAPASPLSALLEAILPITVIGPLVIAFALNHRTAGFSPRKASALPAFPAFPAFPALPAFPLLATFTAAAIPPVLLYSAFLFTDVNPFVPRYYLGTSLAIALLAAWAIAATTPPQVRNFLLGSLVAFSLLTQGVVVRSHAKQDWRGAMAEVRGIAAQHPDVPVLLVSGFQESNFPEYLESPLRRQMVFAPSLVYPGGGREFYLPWSFSPLAQQRIEAAAPSIEHSRQFLLVTMNRAAHEPYLLGRFSSLNLRVQSQHDFESVSVTWYQSSTDR